MVVCINLTYSCSGWMTSNPKWKSKNTTGQPTGFWAGWRRKGSKSEHNINQTEVSEYSTQNGLYPTCAPNTVIIFSIQFICCRQFNLILILLVLRLFQSFLSTLLIYMHGYVHFCDRVNKIHWLSRYIQKICPSCLTIF